MRNYVIINGVDSLTINGLAINELPPISKPPMRTLQEEIDGRDGDIITNLGYGSYDKIMTIGLYNGYDIDEIIAFFNGEGTIIFSNEPDKYYNYKIIEQIDYESLIKFRTATVTFHCQPFKYPVDEEPIEVDYDYIEEEGEDLTLEPTDESPLSLTLKGNTSQDTTTGKNLLPVTASTTTINGITFTINEDKSIKMSGTASAKATIVLNNTSKTIPAGTYTISTGNTDTTLNFRLGVQLGSTYPNTNTSTTTTLSQDTTFYQWYIDVNSGTTINTTIYPMLSTSGGDYEPYTNGASPNPTYPQPINVVTGDNTIEICGKNIFHIENVTPAASYITYDKISENKIIVKNTNTGVNYKYATISPIKVKPNTTYYFKAKVTNTNSSIQSNWLTIQGLFNDSYTSESIKSFNTGTNTIINIMLYTNGATTGANEATWENIQLTTTNNDTYEPYQSQTYPINLPVENLFDVSSITENTYLDEHGDTGSSGVTNLSDYIDIGNNSKCTLSYDYSSLLNNVSRALCFYNSSKTYLSGVSYTPTDKTTTFNIPSNTKYVRFSYDKNCYDIQLEKGSKKNTYTPYGTTPIELCKIGDYQDEVLKSTGKNLMPNTQITQTINGVTLTNIGGSYKISGTATAQVIFQINPLLSDLDLVNGETYTYSANQTLPSGVTTRLEIYNNNSWKRVFVSDLNTNIQYRTATLNTTDGNILRQSIIITSGTSVNINNLELMLEKGSQKTDYEPYGTQWYIHKEIGKVVLDGSEDWNIRTDIQYTSIRAFRDNGYVAGELITNSTMFSNHFLPLTSQQEAIGIRLLDSDNFGYQVQIQKSIADTVDAFKTWLASNNVIVYYPKKTPTNTIITDTTLISQLDNIKNALSYKGQTNIMQVPYDKPFIIKARTMEGGSDEAIINNIGNTYAKPTIDIEGNGIVNVYLNGNQIFAVNVTDEVIIDSTNLEAYNPNTSALENRKVTGNIANLKLNTGTSILKFSGNLTKATITDYVRYL